MARGLLPSVATAPDGTRFEFYCGGEIETDFSVEAVKRHYKCVP